MDELKPCPFCGKPPITSPSGEGGKGLMIECLTEGCVNPHTSYYSRAAAILTWNTRAASGGDVAIKSDRSFTPNLEEPASLEQRADDLFWALMQAPYADTTIGNIVCAETTPQRLESAWIPLLTAALANQQGVGNGWRCFYCDETFTDREAAALHFGEGAWPRQDTPACQIDIAEYRRMEAVQRRYQDEDADCHRALHRQANEHHLALQRAEEAGYARGLKDSGQCPCSASTQPAGDVGSSP